MIKLRKARQYRHRVDSGPAISDRPAGADLQLLREPGARLSRPRFGFVSDNPYRLLSVASSASSESLRRKANSATESIRSGVLVEVSLEAEFGAEMLRECVGLSQGVEADPVLRTIYRQMWPYDLPTDQPVIRTVADMEATSAIGRANRCLAHQREFLFNWLGFVLTSDLDCLRQSLTGFARLYDDPMNEDYLRRMLEGEGEDRDDAYNAVVDAQNSLATHLISETTDFALGALGRGFPYAYRMALKALRTSGLDDHEVRRVLVEKVGVEGDAEEKIIRDLIRKTQNSFESTGWLPPLRRYDASEVAVLAEMAKSLEGVYDGAARWRRTAQERVDQVVRATCRHAVFACDPGSAESLRIARGQILRCLSLPIGSKLKDNLRSEVETIDRLESELAAAAAALFETVPREYRIAFNRGANAPNAGLDASEPRLASWRGTGLKLVLGSAPAADPSQRDATIYLTLFHIPVWPLKRYGVVDSATGEATISKPLRLAGRQNAHILIALGILLALALLAGRLVYRWSFQHQPHVTLNTYAAGTIGNTTVGTDPIWTLLAEHGFYPNQPLASLPTDALMSERSLLERDLLRRDQGLKREGIDVIADRISLADRVQAWRELTGRSEATAAPGNPVENGRSDQSSEAADPLRDARNALDRALFKDRADKSAYRRGRQVARLELDRIRQIDRLMSFLSHSG